MSQLFGNYIVGFPMARVLSFEIKFCACIVFLVHFSRHETLADIDEFTIKALLKCHIHLSPLILPSAYFPKKSCN